MSNPNWLHTLQQELEEMEREDPVLAEAARKYEQALDELAAGGSYRERARRAIAERKKHAAR